MIYGWCLPRITHYIVAVRLKHPNVGILISKYDYSDAYRRIAHSAEAAMQTIVVHNNLVYLSLRLTFGGSPNPPTWCMFSEIVTDLANEIAQCKEWRGSGLGSPAQPTTPDPKREDTQVAIAPGRAMTVEIPLPDEGPIGRLDGFIDEDLINVFLDTRENCAVQPHVVPLAMHVTSRSHAGEDKEPITRRPLLSLPKLAAEGSPAESQIVLGWQLDTRCMTIALPDDKFKAWSADIDAIRTKGKCTFQELDQLVGRLNHASYVIMVTRHFLSRLIDLLTPRQHQNKVVQIKPEVIDDLTLWKEILIKANRGVSINLLVTRQPDQICWSDACPFGIGGYSLFGRAWRIRIPLTCGIHGHKGVNNLLEFVGMIVNVWLECLNPTRSQQACILAIGDNTSAIGWLLKTANLDPDHAAHAAHLFAARHLASVLMKHNCCLALQHIKGELNTVADLLSFAGKGDRGKPHPLAHDDPPNDVLTRRFHEHLSSQVPVNFKISQLLNEILCWVTRVLRITASSLGVARKDATRTQTDCGDGGLGLGSTPDTPMIPSSLCYPTTNATSSQKLSFSVIGQPIGPPPVTLPDLVRGHWLQALSAKPQATWLRRFGTISGQAPFTSRAARTSDPSSGPYSKRTKTTTHHVTSNEQSPHNY